jgi:hypothetical protein
LIGGVNVDADAVECGLEGFLGSTVEHFGAHVGCVGIPGNKDEFGGGSAVVRFEFQIDESVAAVVFGQVGDEIVVGPVAGSLLLDDNGLLVFNLVNVVTELLALLELESVEGRSD